MVAARFLGGGHTRAAAVYSSAMPCPELDRLRQEVAALRAKLKDKTQAREQAQDLTGKLQRGDFEEFLKRKIGRAAQAIESHVRQHHCQES